MAREPLAGEIRLQWWSEVVAGGRGEEAGANPVAAALLMAMERHGLSADALSDLIDAHRFDLYDDPMASIADLEVLRVAYRFRADHARGAYSRR